MKPSFEVWVSQKILSDKKHWWFQALTYLPSFFLKIGIKGRHFLYDHGVIKKVSFSVPVISVGNLVAGGTGKTQVVEFLAQELSKKYRVAILSRGYRSDVEKRKKPFLVDSKKHTPKECGDEPWLLASNVPQACVIVGKKRVLGAEMALEKCVDLILLDDGMQHRQIHRDKEIVVLYGDDPFGRGAYLPQGMLREDPKRLSRADIILMSGQCLPETQKRVKSLSKAPIVSFTTQAIGAFALDGTPINLKGLRVGAFCGIGNPQRFINTLKEMGAEVVASHFLADHKKIEVVELKGFASQAHEKGATLLLCTEKDKVKLAPKLESSLPVGWVKTELIMSGNQDAWSKIVEEIKQLIRN